MAAIAVKQFHQRCVVLALLWKLLSYMLGFCTKKKYSVFVGFITQLCSPSNVCVCVERGHTLCAYINLHLPSSLVWLFCRKTYLLPSPDPILVWLVWTNSSVFTPQRYGPVSTTVQIMLELHSIMDTRQVREYPVEIDRR